MTRLRVALVHGRADPAHDGVADYTVHLADALDRQGVDVVDVPVDPGPLGLLRAARYLRGSRADLAHVQFAPSAFGFSGAPGLLGDLAGMPLVTTLHEYGWWSLAPRVPEAVWSFLERRGLADRETGRLVPRSAAVLTTNADHAATLRDRCGVDAQRAPLRPNVEVDPAAPDRATTRRALGVPVDAELVVFFGFVHPVKGLRYLVDAVARLSAEHPALHLLVLGGFTSLALPSDEAEAFRGELTAHIAAAGAQDRVTITGHRPAGEVSAALQAADVAAFPFTAGATRKSGALLAALDHGLPTLVTRRSDAPDDPDLVDGETVVVAPEVRDVEVLVVALRRLLDDRDLRGRVAAGGHALVRGHDWDTLAASHVATYDEVLPVRILVIDLLGGLGDLIMVLPSVHALAEAHPGAELTVLTHAPGAPLLARDPAVAAVRTAEKHNERAATEQALADLAPDLTVTTTRFDGIGDLVEVDARARGTRAVANLWRRPPADEKVGERYQRILAAEGVIADRVRPPRVVLSDGERASGRDALVRAMRHRWHVTPGSPHARSRDTPTVLVPDAGMAVKRWPARRWAALAASLPGPVLSIGPVDDAVEFPPTDLRGLAARFAAVGEAGGVVVGPDTGPVRLAAAVGARTVGLFGPTAAARYGLEEGTNLQGLPGCPHREPTAITEQVCWWEARCPLASEPACLLDLPVDRVREQVVRTGG